MRARRSVTVAWMLAYAAGIGVAGAVVACNEDAPPTGDVSLVDPPSAWPTLRPNPAVYQPEALVEARRDVGSLHKATVKIEARSGSQVGGVVTVEEIGDPAPGGVRPLKITIDLSGLAPGEHGFHVHEIGDCSDPAAESAGAHFDLDAHHHGALAAADSHVGDLGNVKADSTGHVSEVIEGVTKISLAPAAPNGIVGRALVVHAQPDDMRTQPAGSAGQRLGCGVVVLDR